MPRVHLRYIQPREVNAPPPGQERAWCRDRWSIPNPLLTSVLDEVTCWYCRAQSRGLRQAAEFKRSTFPRSRRALSAPEPGTERGEGG